MIDFLWGLAGATVGMLVTSLILMLVLAVVPGPSDVAPTWSDRVVGVIAGTVAAVMLSGLVRSLVPDPSKFVDNLGLGAGIAAIFGAEVLMARARGHVETARTASSALVTGPDGARAPGQYVPPARFSSAVHRRFAAPEARARYVIAAYRRGLLPAQYVPGLAAELAPLLPFPGAPAWRELAEYDGDGLDGVVDRAARAIDYVPTPDQE